MFHVLRKNPLNYIGGILDCYHFWFERNFEVGVLKWDYFHLKGHLGHYLFHSGEIVNLIGLILVFDVQSLNATCQLNFHNHKYSIYMNYN